MTQRIVVPEAQNTPTLRLQPFVAPRVMCGVRMLAAIRFDDQAGFDASEIGDVGRNGVLPSEVPAAQLPTP
jgi:hypothetical protein